MNPYASPLSNDCDPLSKASDSSGAARVTSSTVLLPAVTFPAGFLATAAIVQMQQEDASSGLAYAMSLVFDFPFMFSSLVICYAIVRAILAWCSLRLPVWVSLPSAAFAFILFPSYFSLVYVLIEPLQNDNLKFFMMGVTPACVGVTLESICLLAITTGKRLIQPRMKPA